MPPPLKTKVTTVQRAVKRDPSKFVDHAGVAEHAWKARQAFLCLKKATEGRGWSEDYRLAWFMRHSQDYANLLALYASPPVYMTRMITSNDTDQSLRRLLDKYTLLRTGAMTEEEFDTDTTMSILESINEAQVDYTEEHIKQVIRDEYKRMQHNAQ